MSTKHLRNQAGGDPAQGPHPDLANPTPSPSVGHDFPDHPDEPVAERPQDQPDLDAFAERMGTDRLGRGARPGSAQVSRGWRGPVSSALGALATGAGSIGDWLKGAADSLAPEEHRTGR
jgi:hypothetical protein